MNRLQCIACLSLKAALKNLSVPAQNVCVQLYGGVTVILFSLQKKKRQTPTQQALRQVEFLRAAWCAIYKGACNL